MSRQTQKGAASLLSSSHGPCPFLFTLIGVALLSVYQAGNPQPYVLCCWGLDPDEWGEAQAKLLRTLGELLGTLEEGLPQQAMSQS